MNSNDISVIDTSADKIIATLDAGGMEPHQITIRNPSISIGSLFLLT